MTELQKIHCVACEGGVPVLNTKDIQHLLTQLKQWQISDDQQFIFRNFIFKNFYKTMAFVNAVAWIANQENHHPDMEIGFNHCLIKYQTHAVNGLTQNDFICAAKIDALDAET